MNDKRLAQYTTVTEVAAKLNVTPQAIRRALKEKRLKGEKLGKLWLIPRSQFKD